MRTALIFLFLILPTLVSLVVAQVAKPSDTEGLAFAFAIVVVIVTVPIIAIIGATFSFFIRKNPRADKLSLYGYGVPSILLGLCYLGWSIAAS